DREVDGVYLVPTDPGLAASCRRAARALGFPVPCPRLLPNPSFGTTPPSCRSVGSFGVPLEQGGRPSCIVDVGPFYEQPFRPVPRMRAFVLQEGGFAAPPEYEAIPGGNPTAAITVIAAPERIWVQVADATIGCDRRERASATDSDGRSASISTCPSSFGG